MKKMARIALSLCVLSTILSGCSPATMSGAWVPETPENSSRVTLLDTGPITVLPKESISLLPDGVSLMMENNTCPVGVGEIRAILRNDTERMIGLGDMGGWVIDKKVGDRWESIDAIKSTSITYAAGYYLLPHAQRDCMFSVGLYYGHLEVGNYRIAVRLWDSTPELPNNQSMYWVYVEFMVA
ncbi:MAG: hypothetical protein FWH51_04655 [Dehalococcoidia bacterium]|nr:hypothetical protein [Dehalococcoidia bacterium]